MAEYQIVIRPSAAKEIEDLPSSVSSRVEKAIDALADDPRPEGVRKLKGSPGGWRIRVGEWRVLYEIDDRSRLVVIGYVRHRSRAYKKGK